MFKTKKKVTEAFDTALAIPNIQNSIKQRWNTLSKDFNLCEHDNEYKGVGWEFVVALHSVNSKCLRPTIDKHKLSTNNIFKLEQLFLNDYLPKTLEKVFSKFDWPFNWKRVGSNKRWIVLIDTELSKYYDQGKKELDLYSFGEEDLKHLRDIMEERHKQLTKLKDYMNRVMDAYGDQFCRYLENKLDNKK